MIELSAAETIAKRLAIAHVGHLAKDIRTEITQSDHWLSPGVGDRHASRRGIMRDKEFVIRKLPEANQDGRLGSVLTHHAGALDR